MRVAQRFWISPEIGNELPQRFIDNKADKQRLGKFGCVSDPADSHPDRPRSNFSHYSGRRVCVSSPAQCQMRLKPGGIELFRQDTDKIAK